MAASKKKVVLVDDHPIVREGLRRLLEQMAGDEMEVVGEAERVDDGLSLIDRVVPDIAIVDIFLKGRDGLELVKSIRCRWKNLAVLVLSMHDEMLYAERALAAGANGYIMKNSTSDDLLRAIRAVLSGGSFVSERVLSRLVDKIRDGGKSINSGLEALSDRELEVFRLLGHGMTTRRIAEELTVSIKTVETYLARIKGKFGIGTINEIIQHAVHWVSSEKFG